MRIAVIGFHPGRAETVPEHIRVGRMVVERLARRGEYTLAIWPQVTQDLDWIARLGAEKCNSHRGAARGADMVLVAMDSVADLRAVLFGAGQAISELAKPGATVLDMSCQPAHETRSIPGELANRGKHYVAVSIEDEGNLLVGPDAIRLRLRAPYGVIERVVPVLELATTKLFTDA